MFNVDATHTMLNNHCSVADEESAAYADDVEDLRWNKRTQQLLRGLQVS